MPRTKKPLSMVDVTNKSNTPKSGSAKKASKVTKSSATARRKRGSPGIRKMPFQMRSIAWIDEENESDFIEEAPTPKKKLSKKRVQTMLKFSPAQSVTTSSAKQPATSTTPQKPDVAPKHEKETAKPKSEPKSRPSLYVMSKILFTVIISKKNSF